MSYLSSPDVIVFPSTRRASTHVTSRLISEQAIANIVNKLIDEDGFTITTTFSVNDPFEFNIHGYYFKIDKGQDILDAVGSADDIYATIVMDSTNELVELVGQDDPDTGEYTGLALGSSEPTGTGLYTLHILHKNNGVWEVYNQSTFKFGFKSVSMQRDVDGGVI